MAYDRLEPFGETRADLRNAILATIMANAFRDTKKHKKPFDVWDFMPNFEDFTEEEKPSTNNLLQKIEQINRILGGKDNRRGKPE